MSIEVKAMPTPNPAALKFVANKDFKTNTTSFYFKQSECTHNKFAHGLFLIRGVDKVYMQGNTLTITKMVYEPWDTLEEKVIAYIKENLEFHDPNYEDFEVKEDRSDLSPEMQKIEEVLDEYIRPGLQGDGGDLVCLGYETEKKELTIKYQGACSSCPSSTKGTLMAIEAILKDKFDKEIKINLKE